jgi:nucleoside phosphorylase
MRVLLVEDSDGKAKQVDRVLRSAVEARNLVIDRARSVISATRLLDQHAYDLLILDLLLPVRDEEDPSEAGGKQVLSEILTGEVSYRPSHIIGLTAYEGTAAVIQGEAQKSLVHIVIYREGDDAWRVALEAKAKYVSERLSVSVPLESGFKTDICIITSSSAVELRQVTAQPGFRVGEYNRQDCLDYFSGEWIRSDGRKLSVIACAAPAMGMTAAAITACKLITRWAPKFLVMTGIAASTKKDLKFGDILVAQTAFDYGSGKIVEIEEGRAFTPSHHQLHIDAALAPILQRWDRDQLKTDEIRRAWHSPERNCPKIVLGVIATGAAVVQSPDLVREILKTSRKVVGLDMESYGVFHSTTIGPEPRPRVLVAKSISDFADHRKNDKWQEYAAFTSARFVFEFFTNSPEVDPMLGAG